MTAEFSAELTPEPKVAMKPLSLLPALVLTFLTGFGGLASAAEPGLERLRYNHPGLVVDLGVGLWAWPMPCDYDGDGDPDLLVACPDKPYNGVYLFENPGGDSRKFPVFRPARKLAPATANMQISYVGGKPRFLDQSTELVDFLKTGDAQKAKLTLPEPIDPQWKNIREKQWRLFDYDGDGQHDLVIGLAPWDEYGWDDAFDKTGKWTRGPLHGFVYVARNNGTDAAPVFEKARKLEAGGKPIDVYGRPSPNLADFDGDGDLDLLCGEFLDGFSYFENTGTRTAPVYAAARKLNGADGQPLKMELEMIVPVAFDWDGDGDQDLICGDEDGRVAFLEHLGKVEAGTPVFAQPKYFRQQADEVKCGALATPVPADWDGDGDEDILCGDSAGFVSFIENLGGSPRKWGAPQRLEAGGKVLRVEAGENGSIQGPAEAKWGYTSPCVADWDQDGRLDLILNSIWGKIVWCRNVGTKTEPRLEAPQPIQVEWNGTAAKPEWNWWDPQGGELAVEWRTTPLAVDWDRDGLCDLVALDHEGYLALYRRSRSADGTLKLAPGERCFSMEGPCEFDGNHKTAGAAKDGLLRLNAKRAGASGRRKIWLTDWDGDGDLDLLVNGPNATWLEQVRQANGQVWFRDRGSLASRVLAGHSTSPTAVNWDGARRPSLLVGAEDGFLYYQANTGDAPLAAEQGTDGSEAKPAAPPARSGAGELLREFVYDSAPFPECHAGTLVEIPGGLVAAWFGGKEEGAQDVGIWISRKVDNKWTAPVEVADGIQHTTLRYPCWNPVLQTFPDGSVVLFYKCGPSPREWWGMRTESADAGKTWSRPTRLPQTIDGPVKNKGILLSDGTLVCGSSTEYDGWRVHLELTKDRGLTWERIGPIHEKTEFNAIQPTVLRHPDGKLQILCRTKEEVVSTASSTDGGKTWSKMTATTLPNPNSGIDAVKLKDGRFLLVYNHTRRSSGTPRGRAFLNIAVSRDGENWEAGPVLENEPGEFSYPACIQTEDGLVHALYTWKREKLRHVVLDPAKLELKPIQGGVWPAQ